MRTSIHSFMLRLSREHVTAICCVVGTCLALFVEREALVNGPPADQIGTIARAIAVPLLYVTPLVWLLFHLIHRAENSSNPEKK